MALSNILNLANPIGLATGAARGVFGIGTGIGQMIGAGKLKAEDMQFMPPALKEMIAKQRIRAGGARMPGQQMAEENIKQGTQAGLKAARGSGSMADILGAATGLAGQQGRQMASLGQQAAQFRIGEERMLQNLLGQKSNIERQDQLMFREEKKRLKNAGLGNIAQGLSGIAGLGISAGGPLNTGQGQNAQSTPTFQPLQFNPFGTNLSPSRFGQIGNPGINFGVNLG